MFNKLFKFIGKIVFWIVVFVMIALIAGYLTINSWMPTVIKETVPSITQTSISMGSTDVSLFKGHISFNGLIIGNPQGFESGDAFKLDELTITFQPKSILTDRIIVDKVLIKGTQITAEVNTKGQINLTQLNQNVQNYFKGQKDSGTTKTAQKTAPKSSKTILIKDLQINDTTIRLGMMGKMQTITMPNIQKQNIGENQKTSVEEMVMFVVDELTKKPLEEISNAGQRALENTINLLTQKHGNSDTAKFLKGTLKQLF